MSRRHRVSLCMIVRDEAATLERCLRSAAPFVDEICILDTGSTDDTIAIAERAGARVARAAWTHHFSEARNASLELATGDWILVLDADETLRADDLSAFDALVDDASVEGAQLRLDNDYGDGRHLECLILRLFRNRPEYRFDGAIHEQVAPRVLAGAKERGTSLVTARVTIDHDGYTETARRDKKKDERNRPIFERAVAERPDDAYLWFKYGDFLRRFDDLDAVRNALTRSIGLLDGCETAELAERPYAAEPYALLALEELRSGDVARAAAVLMSGWRTPPTPMYHWVQGHVELARGRFVEAERAFRRCRALDGAVVHVPAQPGITGSRSHWGLGRALLGQGRVEEAADHFLVGARRWPEDRELQRAAARVELARREYQKALGRLELLLGSDAEDGEAWRIAVEVLLESGLAERAERFSQRALRHAEDAAGAAAAHALAGEVDLARGRVEEAAEHFAAAPGVPAARAGEAFLALVAGEEPREMDAAARRALADVARRFSRGPAALALGPESLTLIGERLQPVLA
ncbi:MAG: glycosyltransferase [Planctomycetota bacterium]